MVNADPLPIALVMSSFEPGGTENQMIELARRLDGKRWKVHVACMREGGTWFDRVASAVPHATFAVGSFKRLSALGPMRAFISWCQDKRFSVVHAVDLPANVFGLPGAALARVPVRVGTRRDVNPGRTAPELIAQRAAYACAHVIVANAHAAADRLRVEGVPARKVRIVSNGLDLARFQPRPLRPPLRRVVTVANLRPEKGHDVMIDAAARVLERYPDARFDFVGGGTEHEPLVARVRARGISNSVSFLGHSEDVPACLAAADIFALPSRTEAFPNAVLEAMASGLPVVASAVGGVREIIEDGRTGLLVRAGDPRALADQLCRLMADGGLGVRLGAAGRTMVEGRFSFDRMVDAFELVYLTELARRGVVPAPRVQLAAS